MMVIRADFLQKMLLIKTMQIRPLLDVPRANRPPKRIERIQYVYGTYYLQCQRSNISCWVKALTDDGDQSRFFAEDVAM